MIMMLTLKSQNNINNKFKTSSRKYMYVTWSHQVQGNSTKDKTIAWHSLIPIVILIALASETTRKL